MENYLGQKGYTIYKNNIHIKEQQNIRDELTVRPYIPNSVVQPNSFPVYRESHKKMYVPRFYGEKTYGELETTDLNEVEEINLNFQGEMRDYQIKITETYLNHVKKTNLGGGGLLEIPCGRGKTVMALKIIEQLKQKTLVIVHKGFLLNQWIERITQFLPNARVGKIQGPYFDIKDKDIVIGMLQSLSMKEYPQSMFKSFGLTIIDECHHVSAEVFVRSLFSVVTPYMLGLSATMQRKDGLTKVFKMFIGDIVYSEKTKQEHNVLVKAIEYVTNDEEFNDVKYDYRGNPQYSTMISKLCNFNHRSEFIVSVVADMVKENPERQLMILGHNKSLLVYLHKAIEFKNIASVGYYIGGMKEKDLKLSETKKIIVATYSMAAEALDIKTLSGLIMVTPKTDVVQSIGRILRTKHEQPVVVDIIDQHGIFQNQWKKRKTYYVKQGYEIIHTNNNLYKNNEWVSLNKKGETKKKKKEEPKCLIKI